MTILGPVLFILLISDTTEGLVGRVYVFADDLNVFEQPKGTCNIEYNLALM